MTRFTGSRFAVSLILLSACLTFSNAQSKKELQQKISDLTSKVDRLKLSLNQAIEQAEKENVRNKGIIDSLSNINLALIHKVELLSDELELNKNQQKLSAAKKKEKKIPKKTVTKKARDISVDDNALDFCLRLKSFQPMFSETITMEYTVTPDSSEFVGLLEHKYTPEYGKPIFRKQKVTGTINISDELTTFKILQIDKHLTEVFFQVNHKKSYKSLIKGEAGSLQKVYTRHVPIEEFEFSDCR